MFTTEELDRLRAETPGTKERIHFNNAGAGLMPKPVSDAIHQYLELESQIGGYEASAMKIREIQGFYSSTAQILNTKARNIAYTSNATDSYSKALLSIVFEQGDIILTTRQDYVSNQIAFLQLQKRFGIQIIRAANAPNGAVDLNDMEALIKQHHPKLVAVTHIPTNSGLIQPVAAIGEFCEQQDILYLVDGCQSAGQLELDMQQIKCDFFSVTMRKFMRGPRGAGYLYVSDKVLEKNLEPLFVDLRGASWTAPNEYELGHSAKRFELWEKPYALMLGSKAANEYALDIGMAKIEERVKFLAHKLRADINELGSFRVLDEGPELGGIVTITAENLQAKQVKHVLDAANINVAISPLEAALIDFQDKRVDWAIRISPHYYNTEQEIELLLEHLQKVL
jgi:selenocysteine lyase/cysteine desulfurase